MVSILPARHCATLSPQFSLSNKPTESTFDFILPILSTRHHNQGGTGLKVPGCRSWPDFQVSFQEKPPRQSCLFQGQTKPAVEFKMYRNESWNYERGVRNGNLLSAKVRPYVSRPPSLLWLPFQQRHFFYWCVFCKYLCV